ncbi:hypothetical protein D9C73_009537 [Collichthys lucidus]|uniref:Uncharacterized protein n=1 Tax=Collichthys lucidus TaxID=240159 RepID=A0A4U5UPH6_COLLU|nr:hypothetical protein D9C73_009537 [Collichthys lucidus]
MSIDDYFLRSRDKRPPKENRNPTKMSSREATASMPDSPPEEERQQLQANPEYQEALLFWLRCGLAQLTRHFGGTVLSSSASVGGLDPSAYRRSLSRLYGLALNATVY